MKAQLIRIGNSQGIRIPKPIIEQCQLGSTVDLSVRNNCIVISPSKHARAGWDAAFRKAAKAKDPQLKEFENIRNSFDDSEWKW